MPDITVHNIEMLAKAIISCRKVDKPVLVFSGAHLIKNGLGPLVVDLIKRNILTLVAGNAATAIHDFELALIGETSEFVPDALGKGQFGMAYEFAYVNVALSLGNRYNFGYGESLGKMICDDEFRNEVLTVVSRDDSPTSFSHAEISVLAACYQNNVPFTVHAGIGVDVIDQHPSFDGQGKGGCSGRDFMIYVNEITKFTTGIVLLNIGSAVQGPEVFLKAISMSTNVNKKPNYIICADFDLRDYKPEQMSNEFSSGYYYRDQKSIVTRVPQAFNGKGLYMAIKKKQFPCFTG
ncbi:MAG: hypothetical protein JSW07_10670 [bacterium]|nr:MAG: hypothetical protein JSW07_10670 [bacterium]